MIVKTGHRVSVHLQSNSISIYNKCSCLHTTTQSCARTSFFHVCTF